MQSSTFKDLERFVLSDDTDPNLTNEHMFSVYRLKQNDCRPKVKICKRNCKGNPFCLSGLGESRLLESRKNPQDSITTLPKRAPGNFVGLKNLGATCYMNSLLQLWFHNKAFRDAIFLWNPHEDPVEQDSLFCSNEPCLPLTVMGHLQQLFALMFYSNCSYIDPSPLVESLQLDPSTQQDAQEFSKLFISLLEETFRHQSLPQVKNLVGDIFRGSYMYVTRCCKCLTESVSPSMFYELELNVKGSHTLIECLADYLREEKLEGADCYSCATCRTKQEASRFIKLRSLPPILNLQLLRFVYDREKGQKKKLKTVVQFPEVLDMKDFVQPTPETPLIYNLNAVLIHKGTSASSGHFVAYIKDFITGTWNTFNDETVKKLEGKKLKLDEEDSEGTSKTKVPRLPKGFQSSTDAYMLVYTSEKHNPSLTEVQLSERLQNYVSSKNKEFNDFCKEIENCSKEDLERQERLLDLYNSLTVDGADDLNDFDVLPVDWLMSWLDRKKGSSQKIDNSKLLCPHGRLDPTAVINSKYVARVTADALYDQYGGGPRLTGADIFCKPCVSSFCLVSRTQAKTLEESKEITNLLKKRMSVDEPGYFVSKNCLRRWRTRVLNLLEEKSNASRKTINVSNKCSNELRPEDSAVTTTSIENKEESLQHSFASRKKILYSNKCSSALQRRIHASTVSVPLTNITDCVVLCERLCLSLNKPVNLNKRSHQVLLNQCKQLKVKLKRLTPSNFLKTSAHRKYLRRRCNKIETKQHGLNSKESPRLQFEHSTNNHQVKQNRTTKEEISENSPQCDSNDQVQLKTEDEEVTNLDDEMESSEEFNEAIRCSHGNLSIDDSKRKLVPVRVWEILKQYFPSAPEFAHDTSPCHQCQNLASQDEVVKQQYYESAQNQKRTFSDLINLRNRPQIGKTEGEVYILHKQNFHQPWSAFLRAASRKDGSGLVDPPVSLNVASLLCEHGLLHYNPAFEDDMERLVLVTSQEWETLLTMYLADCAVTVAPDNSTSPKLCESCFMSRIECEQKEKFTYDRARLNIRVVPSVATQDDQDSGGERKRTRLDDGSTSPIPPELKKVMKTVTAAAVSGAPAGDVRRSARRKKIPGQKDVTLFVSSILTFRELKQKITSQLAVAPFDQHLYTQDGRELVGDTNTLSTLCIPPNSTLLLQVDEPKESFDDVMEEFLAPHEPETGFKGTGLFSAY